MVQIHFIWGLGALVGGVTLECNRLGAVIICGNAQLIRIVFVRN